MTGSRDDLRLAATFRQHPKVRLLERNLGEAGVLALVSLWCFCANDGRLNGSLAGLTDEEIECAIAWTGAPGAWVREAVERRLLDGEPGARAVHSWREEQPWLATRDERRAAARESGRRGGKARAENLDAKRRSEIAALGAKTRYAKGLLGGPKQPAKGLLGGAYLSGAVPGAERGGAPPPAPPLSSRSTRSGRRPDPEDAWAEVLEHARNAPTRPTGGASTELWARGPVWSHPDVKEAALAVLSRGSSCGWPAPPRTGNEDRVRFLVAYGPPSPATAEAS